MLLYRNKETLMMINTTVLFLQAFAAHFHIPVKLMKMNNVVYHCLACQPSSFFHTTGASQHREKNVKHTLCH